jgi:hypothetical protein
MRKEMPSSKEEKIVFFTGLLYLVVCLLHVLGTRVPVYQCPVYTYSAVHVVKSIFHSPRIS